MFELTAELIHKYDQKYLQEIMNMKNEPNDSIDDLTTQFENLEIKDNRINAALQFWQNHKESIEEYTELIYLMKHYISGNLYASNTMLGPMPDDHSYSFETLKKLADNGVLTTNGQCSIPSDQRSYLDFHMFIPNKKFGLKLLSKLNSLGLNISAIIHEIEDDNVVFEDLIYNDDDIKFTNIIMYKKLNINDIGFHTFKKYNHMIPAEECLVTKPGTWCWNDNVCSMFNELDDFVNIKMPKGYSLLTATLHNQDWDDKQVDEILLTEIEKLKKNNYTSVDE